MLSIVIPTLNEEKYLPRLIASIQQQDFTDYEIIVSDANSDDKTREVAVKMGARVVVDKRRHPSFQRNTGARAALGGIIIFLDADSVLPEGFLLKAMNEFQKRNLGIAGFYLDFGSDKIIYHLCSWGYNFLAKIRQSWHPISVGAGIMVKRIIHKQIKGFNETLFVAEDYDYCDRASQIAKFRIIRSVKLPYSIRRMKKEGDWKVLVKWLRLGFFTLRGKTVKKKIVKYDFGNY
ncbi:hypothetical protein COT98_03175 [Candidatus Falkowbacteria bacterium CG10_big_fil_rev_8_21_14_0_10_39_9]|uniref:Glycosyltransferase 2-like domain-containing protein n=1 Tax=Candidatus Falkowbacteria bacterium CG10_big_fil_rev_8_21_14_0_10_39_9 TaxID=1974566 RepID=A0A2M6WP36_9BACT|nr:MAG: hypothetical protein COT98_03175 [Candidatus Falkowbacteria bacterium CG10_big_fil_rev_8_21_14_0_10_39_9]